MTKKSDVGNPPAQEEAPFTGSAYLICECGHPAHLHSAGACGGYVLNKEYERPDRVLGGKFCGCERHRYQVIDEWIANLLSSRQDPSVLAELRCNACDDVLIVHSVRTDDDGAYAYVEPCKRCAGLAALEPIARIEDTMVDADVPRFFKRATGRSYTSKQTCVNDIRRMLMLFWNERLPRSPK